MMKLIVNYLKGFFLICIIKSCSNNIKKHDIEVTNNQIIGSKDSLDIYSYKENTQMPFKDSIQIQKMERLIVKSKWYKDQLNKSGDKKLSILIFLPKGKDSLFYRFKVGNSSEDFFFTLRTYTAKIGEWKLLLLDNESNKFLPVKD